MTSKMTSPLKSTYLIRATVNGSPGIMFTPPSFELKKNNLIKRILLRLKHKKKLPKYELSMNVVIALDNDPQSAKNTYMKIVSKKEINQSDEMLWLFDTKDNASKTITNYQLDIVNMLKKANINPKPLYDLNLEIIKADEVFKEWERYT